MAVVSLKRNFPWLPRFFGGAIRKQGGTQYPGAVDKRSLEVLVPAIALKRLRSLGKVRKKRQVVRQ